MTGFPQLALPRVAARIFGSPLLIQPDKLDAIMAVLRPRFLGQHAKSDPIAAFGASREHHDDDRLTRLENGVAVIQIVGTLVAAPSGVHPVSGMTSYGQIADAVTAAVEDDTVSAILLEIDSPGGEANGVFDLADMIFKARGSKPIWSVANEMALSAAYAIASATDRIILPRTASVGSVGVVSVHIDESGADKNAGLAFSYIFAGAKKVDGNPHAPLSKRARGDIQDKIDTVFTIFSESVARGRRLSIEAVTATEAGVFLGADAVGTGFADEIATFDDALASLSAKQSTGKVFTMTGLNMFGTMYAGVVEKPFNNFFTIGGGSAHDRGQKGPDQKAIDSSTFAVVQEKRGGGKPTNTAVILRKTTRVEAEAKARGVAEREMNTDLVVILGQKWGEDQGGVEVFRDRIGFGWEPDAKPTKGISERGGPAAHTHAIEKEADMPDGKNPETVISAETAGAEKTAQSIAEKTIPAKATGEVIDFGKARDEGRKSALADVSVILELCDLAGMPQLAKGFIDAGTSETDVRVSLLEARAKASDASEVASRHDVNNNAAPDADAGAFWRKVMSRRGVLKPSAKGA